MRTKNDKLGEVYRDNGHWKYDIPVNHSNDICSKCGKKIGKEDIISFQIPSSSGVDYYEYHKSCIDNAMK